MKKLTVFGLLGLFALFHHHNLYAQSRYALLIGNSAYPHSALKNPVNDAIDMGKLLKLKRFQVTILENAGKREMETAIREFTRKLHEKDAIGLFYFAGHGIEMDGINYLIPVDAEIETGIDAKYESVDAGRILDGMEGAGNNLNMVILDACRNNPFERRFRSASKGLARMDAPKGSLMLYATSPGDVAADGNGRNGLFTQHLLKAMNNPNLKVEEVFKQTAINVNSASGGKQLPWQTGVILGDFYFNKPVTVQVSVVEPKHSLATDELLELEYWNSIKDTQDTDFYQSYLDQYGDKAKFSRLAKLKLAKLQNTTNPVSQPTPIAAVDPDKAYFKITTFPKDAAVKFLNVTKTYLPEMAIEPGRYFVQVSKSGFKPYTKWIELGAGKNYHSVSLKTNQPAPAPVSNTYASTQTIAPPTAPANQPRFQQRPTPPHKPLPPPMHKRRP